MQLFVLSFYTNAEHIHDKHMLISGLLSVVWKTIWQTLVNMRCSYIITRWKYTPIRKALDQDTVPEPERSKIVPYVGCSNCGKRTETDCDVSYTCMFCNKEKCIASPR